jgi:hypothetical protein
MPAKDVYIRIPTPESDKLLKVHKESQAIGEFLEWMQSKGLSVCKLDEDTEQYFPDHVSIQNRLAKYYEIDMNKVERERRAILKGLNAAHEAI